MPEPLVLDTDIGTDVDDALALILAANSPELDLQLVTTVNAHTRVRAELARKLLAMAGKSEVPVVAGRSKALPSERFGPFISDGLWMGHEGRGLLSDDEIEGLSNLEADGSEAQNHLEKIIDTEVASNVVTIGPCTNLGGLLKEMPELSGKIKHYFGMGGAVISQPTLGERELPWFCEYNFNADREAAATVLESNTPKTLIPVELTVRTHFTKTDVEELREEGDDSARALASLLDIWEPIFQSLQSANGVPEGAVEGWVCNLHDPLALVALIRPDLLSFENVRISLEEESNIFRTRIDPEGEIEVRVASDADFDGTRRFILERLKGRASALS